MTVLSIAYPMFPVGPDSAGGAEQILGLLERGIVAAGHRSLVIAAEGSCVSGQLIPTPIASAEITDEIRAQAQAAHRSAIATTFASNHVDVVHFHGLDFDAYLPDAKACLLATMHLPLAWYQNAAFAAEKVQLICVSNSQAAGTDMPVVLNGVDTRRYHPANHKENFLLWIGRICPEKGPDVALRVAHALDKELIVAGPVHAFPVHLDYFASTVAPLLDAKRRYIGPVSGVQKERLLSAAQCVLIPSLAAETSSLVAMEAFSSGTPVIAYRSGALPEVIEHGRTGFITDSEQEMARSVAWLNEISTEACRQAALDRFDCRRMVNDYLAMYKRILGTGCAPQERL